MRIAVTAVAVLALAGCGDDLVQTVPTGNYRPSAKTSSAGPAWFAGIKEAMTGHAINSPVLTSMSDDQLYGMGDSICRAFDGGLTPPQTAEMVRKGTGAAYADAVVLVALTQADLCPTRWRG